MALSTDLQALPARTHSEIKLKGVRALVDDAGHHGAVALRNHGHVTAVVVAPERYLELVRRAEQSDPLAALRRQFDERLDLLARRGGADRLDAAFEDAQTRVMAQAGEPVVLAG